MGSMIQLIAELIQAEALELIPKVKDHMSDLYIPYMMNDAVEYYIVLQNCKVLGSRYKDFPADTKVETIHQNGRKGIALRIPKGEFVTLWYDNAFESKTYYQYHGIGHFWRPGAEQWRHLVYAIGTAYDKYEYLGKESCNQAEVELIPLMNFPGFRYYSPIKESLENSYPNREQGFFTAKKLARECGDTKLAHGIEVYRWLFKMPIFPKCLLEKNLAKKLMEKDRYEFYQLIYQKLEQASQPYQKRCYVPDFMARIEQKREQVQDYLHKLSYEGYYPLFFKDKCCVLAMEEHPFTIKELDYEDFDFRIQFMLSKSDRKLVNAGFFEGTGEIVKTLDEIT